MVKWQRCFLHTFMSMQTYFALCSALGVCALPMHHQVSLLNDLNAEVDLVTSETLSLLQRAARHTNSRTVSTSSVPTFALTPVIGLFVSAPRQGNVARPGIVLPSVREEVRVAAVVVAIVLGLVFVVFIGFAASQKWGPERFTPRGAVSRSLSGAALQKRAFGHQVAVQAAMAGVSFGWAVTGALSIPMLLDLGVQYKYLGLCWIISPVFGFALHPLVGSLSDTYGRQVPTVICILFSVAGLAALPLTRALPACAVWLAIVVNGIIDLSLALLLTLSRAAMNDIFDAEESERCCAMAVGLGRVTGFAVAAMLPLELAFFVSAGFMACIASAQLALARPGPVISETHTPKALSDVSSVVAPKGAPAGFAAVWTLLVGAWLSYCVFGFFVSSLWAVRSGAKPGSVAFDGAVTDASLMLTGQAVMFLAFGAFLPQIVASLGGEMPAIVTASFLSSLACLAVARAPPAWSRIAIVVVFPLAQLIGTNTPFAWLEKQEDFDKRKRGYFIGLLDSSLQVAQLTIGLLSGPLVALTGDHLGTIFCLAGVLIGAIASLMTIRLCIRFFSSQSTFEGTQVS